MKIKKSMLILALALVAVLCAFLGACSSSPEEQKRQEGYIHTVTYDANGGSFTANSKVTYALVQDNSLTVAPGYVDKNQNKINIPTRSGFQLVGESSDVYATQSWFVAQTDENGNVIYEGEGENRTAKLASTTPWNFLTDKVTEDITLVAVWEKVYKFIVYYKDDIVRSYTVKPGDTIIDKLYNFDSGVFKRSPRYLNRKTETLNGETITMLDFYMDPELTTLVAEDYVHPGKVMVGEVETNDVKIYAKCLEGKFDFIYQSNILTLNASSNWYLLEDIDLSEKTWSTISTFNGNIYGNGYTISGLKVEATASKPAGSYRTYSLFGSVNGTIKDLTLKNVSVTVKGNSTGVSILGEQRISFFGYEIMGKGVVENVTVEDCSLVIENESTITASYGAFEQTGYLWYVEPEKEFTITIKKDGVVTDAMVPVK